MTHSSTHGVIYRDGHSVADLSVCAFCRAERSVSERVDWCRNEVDDGVWRFLLTGGVALENPHVNPAPDWMSDKSWSEIVRASELPALNNFMSRLFTNVILIHCVPNI